jgi:hypothetical protein
MSAPTGYEVQMYAHIQQIAQALNRIANCLEAAELRAREAEKPIDPELLAAAEQVLETFPKPTTPEDIEQMGQALAAVRRGFADLERGVEEEWQPPTDPESNPARKGGA